MTAPLGAEPPANFGSQIAEHSGLPRGLARRIDAIETNKFHRGARPVADEDVVDYGLGTAKQQAAAARRLANGRGDITLIPWERPIRVEPSRRELTLSLPPRQAFRSGLLLLAMAVGAALRRTSVTFYLGGKE